MVWGGELENVKVQIVPESLGGRWVDVVVVRGPTEKMKGQTGLEYLGGTQWRRI